MTAKIVECSGIVECWWVAVCGNYVWSEESISAALTTPTLSFWQITVPSRISPTLLNLSAHKTPNLPSWATANQTIVHWRKKKHSSSISPNVLHRSHVFVFKCSQLSSNYLSTNQTCLFGQWPIRQLCLSPCSGQPSCWQIYFEEPKKNWHPQLMIIVHVGNTD